MAGVCMYCGHSGTQEGMEDHAGEDCRQSDAEEWLWKMAWCKRNGLAPAKEEVWNRATVEYMNQK